MSRIAFLFRTDVHLADRKPVSWKGDYTEEIWSDLEQIGELARVHKVAAVLDGGDYFHAKSPSMNSHSLVIRSASIHKSYPCPTLCIEGNHDLTYNSLDSVERQPLGVLFETGIFQRLREQVFQEGDLRVRVVGVPYSPDRTLEDLLAIRKSPGDSCLIAVVHQLASPKASYKDVDFKETVFRYSELSSPMGPDVWCFGHYHKDQGIIREGTKVFINHGAISRGALTNENLSREPKVVLIEVQDSSVDVTALPLVVGKAEDVFDLDRKERADAERCSIDQFIFRLQQDMKVDASTSIEANISALNFADDVREAALGYLGRAREEVG